MGSRLSGTEQRDLLRLEGRRDEVALALLDGFEAFAAEAEASGQDRQSALEAWTMQQVATMQMAIHALSRALHREGQR